MSRYRSSGQLDDPAQPPAQDLVWRGVNNRLPAEKLPAGIVADGQNTRMRNGDIEPRLGVVKPGWLNTVVGQAVQAAGTTLYGAGVFDDPLSREWVLLAVDGTIRRCCEGNTPFTLPLPAGVRIAGNCAFVQAFNQVFCFRGRYLATLVLRTIDNGFEDLVPQWSAATVFNAPVLAIERSADEMAYGPFQAVTSLTSSSLIATGVTTQPHGYKAGADVTISGAAQTEYNGRVNILSVPDENTFTYQFAGSGTATATGTITVSNMSLYWSALGSRVTLTSLTRVATTATATKTAHGFTAGQYVTISGATPAGFNGTYVIQTAVANSFTYTLAADPGADATGTLVAVTSVVLAGQSPDTNPEAWQQIYTILPNADDALYINGRLLVPTAYTPGSGGVYNSTSSYTKKDYIVATDVFDPIHFTFIDEFRINEGDDSEITTLTKYDKNTVIVTKGKRWGVLYNIQQSLTGVSFDTFGGGYGCCALRSAVSAGKNVFWPSSGRGIVNLNQTDNGIIQSVDIPLSADVEQWIGRINWTLADRIRLAWWDDKLYAAVPLDGGVASVANLNVVIISGAAYSQANGTYTYDAGTGTYVNWASLDINYHTSKITFNGTLWQATDNAGALVYTSPTLINAQWTNALGGTPTPASVYGTTSYTVVNTAILVYDFRTQQWVSLDTGGPLLVKEFFKATYHGQERLFYIGADGWVNLLEESTAGDQVADPSQTGGLNWAEIAQDVTMRGDVFGTATPKRFPLLELGMAAWNAQFTVSLGTGGMHTQRTLISNQSFSRTQYVKPFDKAPWNPTNVNGDFTTPNRGDYSLVFPGAGLYLTGGAVNAGQYQELYLQPSAKNLAGSYALIRFTTSRGRLKIKAATPVAQPGQRRMGIQL